MYIAYTFKLHPQKRTEARLEAVMRTSGWKAIFLVMKEPQKTRAPPMMPITGQALSLYGGRLERRCDGFAGASLHTCCLLRAWAAARLESAFNNHKTTHP